MSTLSKLHSYNFVTAPIPVKISHEIHVIHQSPLSTRSCWRHVLPLGNELILTHTDLYKAALLNLIPMGRSLCNFQRPVLKF